MTSVLGIFQDSYFLFDLMIFTRFLLLELQLKCTDKVHICDQDLFIIFSLIFYFMQKCLRESLFFVVVVFISFVYTTHSSFSAFLFRIHCYKMHTQRPNYIITMLSFHYTCEHSIFFFYYH